MGQVKPSQRSRYIVLSPLDPSCHHLLLNPPSPLLHSSQDLISFLFNPEQCNLSRWGSVSLHVFFVSRQVFPLLLLDTTSIHQRLPWQLEKSHCIGPSCFRPRDWSFSHILPCYWIWKANSADLSHCWARWLYTETCKHPVPKDFLSNCQGNLKWTFKMLQMREKKKRKCK